MAIPKWKWDSYHQKLLYPWDIILQKASWHRFRYYPSDKWCLIRANLLHKGMQREYMNIRCAAWGVGQTPGFLQTGHLNTFDRNE